MRGAVLRPYEAWRGVSRPARAEHAPTFELAFLEEETEGLVHADDHHDTRKEQDLQTQRGGGREQSSAARSRRGPLGTRRTLPMARSPLSKNIIMPSTMKSKPAPVRPIPISVHDARRTWGLLAAVGRAHSTTGGCGLRRMHFCSRPCRQLSHPRAVSEWVVAQTRCRACALVRVRFERGDKSGTARTYAFGQCLTRTPVCVDCTMSHT